MASVITYRYMGETKEYASYGRYSSLQENFDTLTKVTKDWEGLRVKDIMLHKVEAFAQTPLSDWERELLGLSNPQFVPLQSDHDENNCEFCNYERNSDDDHNDDRYDNPFEDIL